MSFAWPWCFLALPLPWLLRCLLAPSDAGAALRVPNWLAATAAASAPRAEFQLSMWIAALAWLLLVGAAARPQAPGEFSVQPVSGRDLMLAFDVSASMATADLQLGGKPMERLRVARTLADDFLKRRQGDRVGLIVFGSQAYLHTPLTFDLAAVRAALATMETGFAGPETALGDAIGLATKHLTPLADNTRELIVLTDGANTTGTLAPQRAAWLAQRAGVRIHAIGIGAAPVVGTGSADGRTPAGGLDEATLQQLAQQTGGSYLRATDSAAIEGFFRRLDHIKPSAHGEAAIRPQRALYPWPLALALALSGWLALRRIRPASA
ncbi:MAG: VWA domain-containing protein [Polaromonas sp.]